MPAHRQNGGGEEVCIAALLSQLPLQEIAEASPPTPSPSSCCAMLPQLFAHLIPRLAVQLTKAGVVGFDKILNSDFSPKYSGALLFV